jgi:predicted Na+-dependent transporter
MLMVTVGMELEAREFCVVARRKGALLGPLLLPAILLPVLGFALACGLALVGLSWHPRSEGRTLLATCPEETSFITTDNPLILTPPPDHKPGLFYSA